MTSRTYKIGQLGKVITGKTPSTGKSEYWSGDYPFITIPDLSDLPYVEYSARTLSESGAAAIKSQLLPENSVLMSCIATIGKCGITTKPSFTNQQINSVIPNEKVNPLFLLYLFRNLGVEMTKYGSGGTVYSNISKSLFESIEVEIPDSLDTQLAIANVLASLDAKIANNNARSKTLEEIAQAIFKSWFIDFDPVKAKMAGEIPAGMDTATAALFPDSMQESELGIIPKGWTVEKFGEVNDLLMGQSPPGNTYNSEGEGLPFYQGRTDFGFRFPKQRIFCTQENRVALPGETLVSVRAPVGDVNQAIEKCIIGRGVAATMHKSKSGAYTFSLLKSLYPRLAYYNGEGTVFGAINRSDFNNMSVVEPTAPLVESYEAICGPMNQQIRSLFLATEALIQLRDSLLPRLISGELQIPEEMLAS